MKIIFMGTPQFAVPTFQALIESDHDVSLVVTQPDKPVGRSGKPRPPAIKKTAQENGIETFQPESLKNPDVAEKIKELQPDIAVVIAYGKILPDEILQIPRFGCINVHASLLPAYRGAAPINWAIVNGETQTGVTIMQMDTGMDTGPVITQRTVPILVDDDAISMAHILSTEGAALLIETLEQIANQDRVDSTPQDESVATYAPLLKKEDGILDWDQRTESLICRIRGMQPWPGAVTTCQRGNLKILKVEPAWESIYPDISEIALCRPGTVVEMLKGLGPLVRTSDGFLLVTQGQIQGKRAMQGVDIVNGGMLQKEETLGG
jgi:methionyl-tRNA formyltransferase